MVKPRQPRPSKWPSPSSCFSSSKSRSIRQRSSAVATSSSSGTVPDRVESQSSSAPPRLPATRRGTTPRDAARSAPCRRAPAGPAPPRSARPARRPCLPAKRRSATRPRAGPPPAPGREGLAPGIAPQPLRRPAPAAWPSTRPGCASAPGWRRAARPCAGRSVGSAWCARRTPRALGRGPSGLARTRCGWPKSARRRPRGAPAVRLSVWKAFAGSLSKFFTYRALERRQCSHR